MAVEVAQDYLAIRKTALKLFEYAAQVSAAGEAAGEVPQPEIDIVVADWVRYLVDVESALGPNGQATGSLRIDVARGLKSLREARAQFQKRYMACPGCGQALPRFAQFCLCGWREKQGSGIRG